MVFRASLSARYCGRSDAGKYNEAGVPNVVGSFWTWGARRMTHIPPFSFSTANFSTTLETPPGTEDGWMNLDFSLASSSPIYGASDSVIPASAETPVALYMGRATEV